MIKSIIGLTITINDIYKYYNYGLIIVDNYKALMTIKNTIRDVIFPIVSTNVKERSLRCF